jgi:hypothetical protein
MSKTVISCFIQARRPSRKLDSVGIGDEKQRAAQRLRRYFPSKSAGLPVIPNPHAHAEFTPTFQSPRSPLMKSSFSRSGLAQC